MLNRENFSDVEPLHVFLATLDSRKKPFMFDNTDFEQLQHHELEGQKMEVEDTTETTDEKIKVKKVRVDQPQKELNVETSKSETEKKTLWAERPKRSLEQKEEESNQMNESLQKRKEYWVEKFKNKKISIDLDNPSVLSFLEKEEKFKLAEASFEKRKQTCMEELTGIVQRIPNRETKSVFDTSFQATEVEINSGAKNKRKRPVFEDVEEFEEIFAQNRKAMREKNLPEPESQEAQKNQAPVYFMNT